MKLVTPFIIVTLLVPSGCATTRQLDVSFPDGTRVHYASTMPWGMDATLDSAELTTRPVGIKLNGSKTSADPAAAALGQSLIDAGKTLLEQKVP